VWPEASSRSACSCRTVAATKRPNFVPFGTCGLPIVQMVAVEFVTLASTRQPWLVITETADLEPEPDPAVAVDLRCADADDLRPSNGGAFASAAARRG